MHHAKMPAGHLVILRTSFSPANVTLVTSNQLASDIFSSHCETKRKHCGENPHLCAPLLEKSKRTLQLAFDFNFGFTKVLTILVLCWPFRSRGPFILLDSTRPLFLYATAEFNLEERRFGNTNAVNMSVTEQK